MDADVNKLRTKFINAVNDLYNKEVYLMDSCHSFSKKYDSETNISDLQLRTFFEENNYIVLNGKRVKYCTKDSNNKISIVDISKGNQCTNDNYVIEDTWEGVEW